MTLNGKIVYGAHQENLNEDTSMISAAKCIMISVSRDKVCASSKGTSNESGVLENGDAQTFNSKFPTIKLTLLYSNTRSLVGFLAIPKCVILNDF